MVNAHQLAESLRQGTFVDLSPTIENGMPRWVSHPPLVLNSTVTHEHDGYYCQTLFIAEHTGSHVDAPAHVRPELMDQTVDKVPVETLLAPAKRFDLRPLGLGPGDLVDAKMLERLDEGPTPLGKGDIALLNFGWWERYWRCDDQWRWYAENAPGLAEDACAWLADRGIVAAGSDTAGFDIPICDGEVRQRSYAHEIYLLPRGILIIECLANLNALDTWSLFVALPLKIDRGSGSPIRAVGVTFNRGGI
jgi:kynurenine formamidase